MKHTRGIIIRVFHGEGSRRIREEVYGTNRLTCKPLERKMATALPTVQLQRFTVQ